MWCTVYSAISVVLRPYLGVSWYGHSRRRRFIFSSVNARSHSVASSMQTKASSIKKKRSSLVTLNFCICDSASLCNVQIVAAMQYTSYQCSFCTPRLFKKCCHPKKYQLENVLHVLCLCPMISSNYSRRLIAGSLSYYPWLLFFTNYILLDSFSM